ncbi:MAG: hypothetical protein H7Y01_10495 [Ferruginibacter sp.]|nr:hypothetical protein [Chitinophagaceae bacterium]
MHRLFILSIGLLSGLVTLSQELKIPAEAKFFIPDGYEPLDYIAGDLNSDKKPDALLLLKKPWEDSINEEQAARPLLLLIRQADGKLKQVLRNDNAIMCRHCGGAFGDPYEGTELAPGGFSLSFYGGSSWRWGNIFRFAYKPLKKNWYLVKENQTSFQSGDPETTMKKTEIGESELGEVLLEKFDYNSFYEDSQWKVNAIKTFFYDNPKPGSKPRKAYLVKGNIATGIRQLKNFVELSFSDGNDNITTGFVLRKDIERLK